MSVSVSVCVCVKAKQENRNEESSIRAPTHNHTPTYAHRHTHRHTQTDTHTHTYLAALWRNNVCFVKYRPDHKQIRLLRHRLLWAFQHGQDVSVVWVLLRGAKGRGKDNDMQM